MRLANWLAVVLEARRVELHDVERLSGGAIQDNLGLSLTIDGGSRAGRHELVLRTDAPSSLAVSWGRMQEFAILQAAHGVGVTVPEPWLACDDRTVIGAVFYLMARVPGVARGIRLVRDPLAIARGEEIAAELGRELARLHRLKPPVDGLGFIPVPEGDPLRSRIAQLRQYLDAMDAAEPVLEWGLRWLELHAPRCRDLVLIHADCRTGNYLVEDGRLTAILDWEFACYSDPLEDLGWLLARCWRYGVDTKECGGIGSRTSLLDAYEAEAGHALERPRIAFFELLATLRWAVIALMQADRHQSGRERSLELALTYHVLPGLEAEVVDQVRLLETS